MTVALDTRQRALYSDLGRGGHSWPGPWIPSRWLPRSGGGYALDLAAVRPGGGRLPPRLRGVLGRAAVPWYSLRGDPDLFAKASFASASPALVAPLRPGALRKTAAFANGMAGATGGATDKPKAPARASAGAAEIGAG